MKQNRLFKRGVKRTQKLIMSKRSHTAADDAHRVALRQSALHKVNKVPEFLKPNILGVYHE